MPDQFTLNNLNTSGADTDIMSALKSRLLGDNASVSSSTTSGIDQLINDSIANIQKANESNKTAVAASYDQQKTEAQVAGSRQLTGAQEGTQNLGAASSYAILSQIQDNTNKTLKDLDLREQQALATGDQQAAQSIADLKVKQIQFQQDAQTKVFQNLLSFAGLQIQQKQLGLQASQQSFTEKNAMAQLAAQFGVALKPGDTLDTVSSRIAPFASEQQKLQIAKLKADINQANAETQKALRGDSNLSTDPMTISALASTYNTLAKDPNRKDELNNFLATLQKQPAVYANVINQIAKNNTPQQVNTDDLTTLINKYKSSGVSKADLMQQIATDPTLLNKSDALRLADKIYGKETLVSLAGRAAGEKYIKPLKENISSIFGGGAQFLEGLFSQ